MKQGFTISRYWNSPVINHTITDEYISLNLDLNDFKSALAQEIHFRIMLHFKGELAKHVGSVTTTFTQSAFNAKLNEAIAKSELTLQNVEKEAVDAVIKKIKEESIKIV